MRQLRERGRISTRRLSLVIVAAVALAGCGNAGDAVPGVLADEAAWMAGVEPPADWVAYRTDRLTGDQFLRGVDGVDVVFAGDFRDNQVVRATAAGVAWQSPVLVGDVAQRCAEAEAYMSAAGASGFDVAACEAAPANPDLQVDFVYSFWSSVDPTDAGTRSFGGGVVVDERGAVTVVVSLAANID